MNNCVEYFKAFLGATIIALVIHGARMVMFNTLSTEAPADYVVQYFLAAGMVGVMVYVIIGLLTLGNLGVNYVLKTFKR